MQNRKILQSPGTILCFKYLGKKKKNKLKQSEIEAKMIIKMKVNIINVQIGK